MSTISSLSGTTLNTRQTQLSGATELRDAWLNSAEHAGLRDALNNIKRFLASRAAVSPDGQLEFERLEVLRQSSQAVSQVPGAQGLISSIEESTGTGSASSISANPAGAASSLSSPTTLLPSLGFRPLMGSFAAARGIANQEVEALPSSANMLATTLREALQARNITVLSTETGLEIWLRDSSMSKSGLLTWLAGMRQSMAALGTSLVRLSLNGKTVYQLGQNRQSGNGSLEA